MSREPLIRPGLSTSIKKDLPKIKAVLRAKVPNLELRDIQIQTMAYQAVLRYELCSARCLEALKFYDEMVTNDGKSFETTKYNELSEDMRDALLTLWNGLYDMEKDPRLDTRVRILLDLALYFEEIYEKFPWTTKKLYEMALNSAEQENSIHLKMLVFYHYANFSLLQQDIEDASIKIQTAFVLARDGKNNEKLSISENDESASLIKSVMLRYFKIFLLVARKMTDKQEANKIAMDVIAIIDDTFFDDPITRAPCFCEYGDFLQTNKLFLMAIDAWMIGMGEAKKVNDAVLQCTAIYNVAVCYKELGNLNKAEKFAKKLRETATQELWIAEALLLLAQISEANNDTNTDEAIHFAEQSLSLFEVSPPFPEKPKKLDQARLIVAQLKSQKMYPAFLDCIVQSEMGSRQHFFNILTWQTSRKFPRTSL